MELFLRSNCLQHSWHWRLRAVCWSFTNRWNCVCSAGGGAEGEHLSVSVTSRKEKRHKSQRQEKWTEKRLGWLQGTWNHLKQILLENTTMKLNTLYTNLKSKFIFKKGFVFCVFAFYFGLFSAPGLVLSHSVILCSHSSIWCGKKGTDVFCNGGKPHLPCFSFLLDSKT